jgi:uncharacterized membrane protein YhaH (DUF805 family)
MTFGESIKTCLTKYAAFDGRASRSEFWWFVLFQLLLTLGAQMISHLLGGLLSLALFLPALAAAVRRLHDIGKSGWLVLVGLIPLIGWLLLLYWNVQPGSASANDYGPPPAAGDA